MNIGDYVRTDYGIGKIIEILQPTDVDEPDLKLDVSDCNDYPYIFKSEVIKSSPNIIDLIEVGDFIKYNPVQNHYEKKITLYKAIKDVRDLLFLKYQVQTDKLKILSILTKEQFESMEYKL